MSKLFTVGYLKKILENLDDHLSIVIKTHGFDGTLHTENFLVYQCDDDPDFMIMFEITQDNPYSRLTLRNGFTYTDDKNL